MRLTAGDFGHLNSNKKQGDGDAPGDSDFFPFIHDGNISSSNGVPQ